MFLFAPDDGAGSGALTPPPPATPAAPALPPTIPPAELPAKPDPEPAPEADDGNGGDDASASVVKRIERAKREAQAALLKDLGFEDAEALKKLVADAKAKQEGELTAVQKAEKTVADLTKQRDELQVKYDALSQEVQGERRSRAITTAARNAKHPADVVTWGKEHAADDLAVVLNEDGTINEAKAKALVVKCQKDRPDWFTAETPGSPSNSGAQTPGTADQIKKLNDAAKAQIKSFF